MRTCGSWCSTAGELGQGRPGVGHLGQEVQGGQDPVAGRGVVGHDDVAALLAAEHVAAGAHRLEHVAVTDSGLDDGDAGLAAWRV